MGRFGKLCRAMALVAGVGPAMAAPAETPADADALVLAQSTQRTVLPQGYAVPPYRAPGQPAPAATPAPAQWKTIRPAPRLALSTPIGDPFNLHGSPGDPVPSRVEHNIPHLPQEEPLWCWAAAAQQAIGWVNRGRAPAQCAIVALAHGMDVNACCADPKGICAKTGEIPAIATLINRFGGIGSEIGVPRDPKLVYRLARSDKTLLIRLRPEPHDAAVGIRHMIMVRGIEWYRMPNGRLRAILLYNDPLGEGQRSVDFKEIEPFFEQALLVERR